MATDIRTAYRSAVAALMLAPPDEQTELAQALHQLYLDGRAAELFGASTPGGLPYPVPTDPVAAGADAIHALADAIEAKFAAASGAALHRIVNLNVANGSSPAVALAWSAGINSPAVGGTVPAVATGITVGQAGVYQIHTTVHWDANSTGTRTAQITINGANVANDVADARPAATAGRTINDVMRAMRLNQGDVVNVVVTQTSGVTLAMIFARLEVYRTA